MAGSNDDKALYDQGVALGSKLPPSQTKGLLSQILQSGAVKDPTEGLSPLGSAASDPAPAIADMQQIGSDAVRQPQNSAWAPPATTPSRTPQRTPLQLPQFDQSAINPAFQGQNSDVEKLRALADQTENAPQRTNLSAIAQYVDSIAGTNYAKSYQAPLSPDQKIQEVAKLRQMAATADNQYSNAQLKALLGQQRNDGIATRALAQIAGQQGKTDDKKAQDLNKQFINFGKDADELTQKRNTIGLIAGTNFKASHIGTLLDRYSSGDKLSGPENAELGTSVATMLSGGMGQVAQAQIEHFAPPGMGKTAAEIQSYFTNNPVGTEQGEWVNRFGQTAYALQQQSEQQQKDWEAQVANRNEALYADKDHYRNSMYRVLSAKGFTKKEVDKIFSNDNLDEQAVAYKGLQGKGNPGGVYSGQVIPAADLNSFRSGGIPKNPPPVGPTGQPVNPVAYRNGSDSARKKIWGAYSATQPASEE